MEAYLYPKNLEGLGLDFAEAIYAIAFELEDELHAKGKTEVFAELNLTPEQMAESVEKALDEISDSNAYALRRVLGDLDASQDVEKNGNCSPIERRFENACKLLKKGVVPDSWMPVGFRYLLLGDRLPWTVVTPLEKKAGNITLRERITSLTAEVQFYAERCHHALEQLQVLTKIVEAQESGMASDVVLEDMPMNSVVIDGIYWPYWSAEVLRNLGFTKIEEIVEYFGDFRNFVGAQDITLMEWSVITTILREKELLPVKADTVVITALIGEFEFSIRTSNCLVRAGIKNVGDLMIAFADGAEKGWGRLMKVRNLGRKSLDEIIQKLMTVDFALEDSWCYITSASPVEALDFNYKVRKSLQYYQIQTVGQLYAACQDRNRFTGLRYVDKELYEVVTARLNRYGFC